MTPVEVAMLSAVEKAMIIIYDNNIIDNKKILYQPEIPMHLQPTTYARRPLYGLGDDNDSLIAIPKCKILLYR